MNFKKAIITILYLIPLAIQAQWQQNTLPLDDYEDLYGISFVGNNDLFICSNTQISHTMNGGQSWEVKSLNNGFPFNLFLANTVFDLHFINDNQGLATGVFNLTNDELVIRTTDGGNTWDIPYSNSPFNPPVFFNALDVQGAHVLVCGENGHILRSTDSGNSFSTVHYSAGLELKDIKFLDANRAIAIGPTAVLRSNNGGLSWTSDPAFTGADNIALAAGGLVYMTGASGMLRSADNGISFNVVAPVPEGGIGALAASHDTLFASSASGIIVSTNGGVGWRQFKETKDKSVNRLEIHNGKAYALCNNKTLLILDIATMQPDPIARFVYQVDLQCGESKLSAYTQADTSANQIKWFLNGDLISTGLSFQHVYDTLPWYSQIVTLVVNDPFTLRTDTMTESIGVGFRDKVVADAGPDIYQCYGSQMYLEVAQHAQFIEWLPHQMFDVEHEDYYSNPILTKRLFSDQQIILKASNDSDCIDYDTLNIFVGPPLDEAFDYRQIDLPNVCSDGQCTYISDLQFVSDSIGFGVTNGGYFIQTKDAGNTWSKLKLPGISANNEDSGLDFLNEQVGYVGNPFAKTTDGGQTFVQMPVGGDDVSFINENVGVVVYRRAPGHFTEIRKTLDGGQTFTQIYNEQTNGAFFSPYDIKMLDSNLIFTGGQIGSSGSKLLRSLDGGQSWENLPLPNPTPIVGNIWAFSKDSLFFVWGHTIYRTYDAGQNWFTYHLFDDSFGSYLGTIRLIDHHTGYASTGIEVYKTTNGGDCWTKVFRVNELQQEEFEQATIYGFTFPPSGRSMYFAASDVWADENPAVYFRRLYRELKGKLPEHTCVGTTVQTYNQSFGYTHFQWYLNGSLTASGYNTSFTFSQTGVQTVQLVADSAGYFPDTIQFQVNVKSAPGAIGDISGPISLCANLGTSGYYTLPDTLGFVKYKWFWSFDGNISYPNEAFTGSNTNEFPVYLYPSLGKITLKAIGYDSLGCLSPDTAVITIKVQNQGPPVPAMLSLDKYCIEVDSNDIIQGISQDSLHCTWETDDNVDYYLVNAWAQEQTFTGNSGSMPVNYFCIDQYTVYLTNINACGQELISQNIKLGYKDLPIQPSPDTLVIPGDPIVFRIQFSPDAHYQALHCNPPAVEWYFEGNNAAFGPEYFRNGITAQDTGFYTALIYNGCDIIEKKIHLGLLYGVGTKEQTITGGLSIFPNPNTGIFSVELSEPAKSGTTFQITDLTGRLIQQQKTEPGSAQQTVRTGELPAGLYFLQVVSEGKVLAVEKFVKQ